MQYHIWLSCFVEILRQAQSLKIALKAKVMVDCVNSGFVISKQGDTPPLETDN